jgi:hypothetical protein
MATVHKISIIIVIKSEAENIYIIIKEKTIIVKEVKIIGAIPTLSAIEAPSFEPITLAIPKAKNIKLKLCSLIGF